MLGLILASILGSVAAVGIEKAVGGSKMKRPKRTETSKNIIKRVNKRRRAAVLKLSRQKHKSNRTAKRKLTRKGRK